MKVRTILFITLLGLLSLGACAQSSSATGYDGIDVSRHQGDIDWSKVAKDKSIQFVYIKATEGSTYTDPKYMENIKEARESGLKVGSYHYFRMTSSVKAQFKHMKKVIKKSEQDLIPMIDVEITDGHSVKVVRERLKEFIALVTEYYGAEPMIYGTNRSYNEICGSEFKQYKKYIGRYGKNAPVVYGPASVHYFIWQYSESGTINGIPKKVDLCRFHPDSSLEDILLVGE